MLYGVFVFFMMLMSVMGIIHMTVVGSYTYIIFPVSTFVWGAYKFFKDDDDYYCRVNGIKGDLDSGWLFGFDDTDNANYDYYNNHYKSPIKNNKTVHFYQDPEYKKIIPRCKKNSLVTTDKIKIK